MACSATNKNYQEKLIESARIVLQQSVTLVNEAKCALAKPSESVENQQRLAQIARTIAQSLYECVNCLPGQKDIDEVIKNIGEYSAVLFDTDVKYPAPTTSKKLAQVQVDLNEAALSLNQATNQIVIDSRKGISTFYFDFQSIYLSYAGFKITLIIFGLNVLARPWFYAFF